MIVLSMLVSIFPLNAITAFADDGRLTDGSTKADIIYDYMNFKSDYDLAGMVDHIRMQMGHMLMIINR